MPKVAYYGGRPSVDLELPEGTVTVERGHQIEVSAEVRDNLVAQGDGEIWKEVKPPSSGSAQKKES